MKKILEKIQSRLWLGITAFVLAMSGLSVEVQAKDVSIQISGTNYMFEEKSHYNLSEATGSSGITAGTDYGVFSISGDIERAADYNGFKAYDVKSGNISFSYNVKSKLMDVSDETWHLIDDKTKVVNGIELDSKILSGAVILQSSFDGNKWVTDSCWNNIHSEKSDFSSDFFVTNDIELINGCYYRVIVAYKETKKVTDGGFMKVAKYETIKNAEVYSFYAISKEEKNTTNTSASGTPRKEFSYIVNTGKDTGYDIKQGKDLDIDDPHFGWKLGYFTVNGYTRETKESDGNVVFLKTVGDDITLWFTLCQDDIFNLNNSDNLSISRDKNGYDKNYQIKQTDFKHGALIVKYTDEEGNSHDPVIYTNFLEANTRTGADTKIQIYEEGEYEVALDYEIKNTSRKVGTVEVVPEYTNYKLYFKFSIRNGNTMVFPRDLKAPYSELKDGQITEAGFSIDLAKSKYLTIDIVREIVTVNEDGTISLDVRNNTVGKDNKEYTQEGKYTITVKNLYSNGDPTPKVIYVGTDKYLLALSKGNLSVDKLNEKILQGYTVDEGGFLVEPVTISADVEEKKEETNNSESTVEILEMELLERETGSKETDDKEEQKNESENSIDTDIEKEKSNQGPIVVFLGVVVCLGAYLGTIKKKSTKDSMEDK